MIRIYHSCLLGLVGPVEQTERIPAYDFVLALYCNHNVIVIAVFDRVEVNVVKNVSFLFIADV